MNTVYTGSCCLGNARRRFSGAGSLFSPRTDFEAVGVAARFYCHLKSALQTALTDKELLGL